MNIILWVLQILLAIHTAVGAIWKFSHSIHEVPSLEAIPDNLWVSLSGLEFICAVGLVLPLIKKRWGMTAPIAASVIAAEMIIFCLVHYFSGADNYGEVIYWLVVAGLCGIIAYNRFTKYRIQ